MTAPELPTNGELAYQGILFETEQHNSQRRYRLLSSPDLVISLGNTAEASQVAVHLMTRQDQLSTDLSVIMPHIVPVELPEPIFGD